MYLLHCPWRLQVRYNAKITLSWPLHRCVWFAARTDLEEADLNQGPWPRGRGREGLLCSRLPSLSLVELSGDGYMRRDGVEGARPKGEIEFAAVEC